MPLDTAPLSKTRRLIAGLVLLAMFGGSLGMAGMIVHSRRNRPEYWIDREAYVWNDGVKVVFNLPENFHVDTHDNGGNPDRWILHQGKSAIIISRIDGSYSNLKTKISRPVLIPK